MKLENILLIFLVIAISILFGFALFQPDNSTIFTFTPYISAIILLVSICFMSRQAEYAERMIEITSRPHISVGIMSFRDLNEIIISHWDEELENTRIIIKNFSNITAFVWTKVKLEINNKEKNEHIRIKDYCSAKATWELDPNELIHPLILEKSILNYQNQEISISVLLYFSSIRELPKNPKWIELTTYSFREEKGQWFKNNLGIPFHIQGLFIKH